MFSLLADLQKERGFPHPSRKKKLLKFKRESTRFALTKEWPFGRLRACPDRSEWGWLSDQWQEWSDRRDPRSPHFSNGSGPGGNRFDSR
jgi:hypothetical protein